jgi:hypothetical protein
VPIETEPRKYDPAVLLLVALSPIRVHYTSIIPAYQALRGQNSYGRLPWLALSESVLGGRTSNALSGSLGGLKI